MLDAAEHVERLCPGSVVPALVVYISSGYDHVPILRDRRERMQPI